MLIERYPILGHNRSMATPRKQDDLTRPSQAELDAIEEGRADIAAGRYVDHKDMAAWFKSWGTDPHRPPPKLKNESDDA